MQAIRRGKIIKRIGVALGVLSVGLGALLPVHGFTFAQWAYEGHCGMVLSRGITPEKIVALTFDDGPDPQTTPEILAVLKQNNIRATFFVQGRMVEQYPELARQTAAAGHVIGNHTFSHPYLTRLTTAGIQREMRAGERSIETYLHCKSTLFRPPRGDWNPAVFREAKRTRNHIVLWTIAVEHQDARTPEAMANRALKAVKPGAILLMHDGAGGAHRTTAQALPLLLAGLKQRGYRCVTVPELLHISGDKPVGAP